MEENKELDHILYMKGIVLTDEQRIAFNNLVESIRVFGNDLITIVNSIFQEEIKPILMELKKTMEIKDIRKGYILVKDIKPRPFISIKRPKLIHCRNNC
jgi:hypothetical protein